MAVRYDINDLKAIFLGLKPLNYEVCIPVFSVVITRFLNDLSTDFRKYGVDSCDHVIEFNENTDTADVFMAMSGIIMIKIILRRTNIYVTNGSLVWYLPSSIIFDAGNANGFAEGLRNKFADFVRRQNLVGLKKEARLVLKKGSSKSLRAGIAEFYLS